MDEIILYLLKKGNTVSGEEIASRFGISRAAVWKHIQKAGETGFIIRAERRKGYKIEKFPSHKIIPELIQFYYGEKLPLEIILLEQTDSTNNYAKKASAEINQKDFTVITEEQVSGKGRLSRSWKSEKGLDITFSYCLKIEVPVQEFYRFTIAAAEAVFQSIYKLLEEKKDQTAARCAGLKIKWPNDIYYNGKKICGILSEMITEEMLIKNIIVGIGINVNSVPSLETAVSLKQITGKDTDRNGIIASITKNLFRNIELIRNGDFETVFHQWKRNLTRIGEEIRFDTGREIITGILEDIQSDGAVIIHTVGIKRVLYSGDLD